MSRAIPLLPLWAFGACYRANFELWFENVQRIEENNIFKTVLYMNLETTILRNRPTNRWQDEVRDDRRIFGGEEWQEKVCNREEWKQFLTTARNRRILHMSMERMNVNCEIPRI
jgi:hypothetical protein